MKSYERTRLGTLNGRRCLACGLAGLGLLGVEIDVQAQAVPPPRWPNSSWYVPRAPKKSQAPPPAPALIEPGATVAPERRETTTTIEAASLDPGVSPADGLTAPAVRKSEVSLSGDFSFGLGQITLPIAYSLNKSIDIPDVQSPDLEVASADRESVYFGGTISYSYGQQWYLDLSYAQGSSSGDVDIDTKGLGDLPARFSIDDEWYQLYVRYAFPNRGKPLSAYLRAGATFVQADLEASAVSPVVGSYQQEDSTEDILGNVGFGLSYSLYATRRVRFALQGEGEGFFGFRSQESLERLNQIRGIPFQEETIDNTLYGGIARVTARFQYNFGQSGAFKAFAEGGAQVKYTIIEYPEVDAPDELLWGPYVKLGVRYAF